MLSLLILGIVAFAAIPQQDDDDKDKKNAPKVQPKAQPKALTVEDESIPDSLVHSRWKIQKTAPVLTADLDSSALDLRMPENVKQQVEYNDSLNLYVIGSKMGDSYLNTPILMTPEEYRQWSEKRERERFFRQKDAENVANKGKEKFDFAFGPGGVRVKTQGTAELKIGATLKDIDNPSLPIRNRKTTSFDFDEKVNLSVNGKVGDKVNMNLNYNTDATFDFDTKNLATRISCAVIACSGLVDGTCPPHTNIAPFNNLQTPESDKEYYFYPKMGHEIPAGWSNKWGSFFNAHMQ